MNKVGIHVEKSDVIIIPTIMEEINDMSDIKSTPVNMKTSKWKLVRDAKGRLEPSTSQGEIKLSNFIAELQNFALVKEDDDDDDDVCEDDQTSKCNWIRLIRRRLAHYLHKPAFNYVVISVVLIDLIVVLVDLILAQLSSPCLTEAEMEEYHALTQRDSCLLEHSVHLEHGESFLFFFSVLILSLFVVEVFLSLFAFGWKYVKNPLYLIDGGIVLASFIMELYFHYGNIGSIRRATSAIIMLRLWKIVRAIHAVAHSITLKNRILIKRIEEAKILLEAERELAERTFKKQEIRLDYCIKILTNLGKLPSTKQIERYINDTWTRKKKLSDELLSIEQI